MVFSRWTSKREKKVPNQGWTELDPLKCPPSTWVVETTFIQSNLCIYRCTSRCISRCISSHKKTCKPYLSQPTINSFPQQNIEDTIWQVGCYQINPTTPRGQKFFILHMLVKRNRKCFSHDCSLRCFLSSQSQPWWSRTVWTWTPCWVTRTGSPPSDGRWKWKWKWKPKIISHTHQVRGAMEIALFIQNIQEERAEVCTIFWASPRKIWPENFRDREKLPEINVQVALYIFTNQSDSNMTEVKYNENRFVLNSSHNNALQWRFSAWIICAMICLKR